MSEIKTKRYIKASIFKRFTAFLGDLLLIIIGLMLISGVVTPIINGTKAYKDAKSEYDRIALASGLFVEVDGEVDLPNENYDYYLKTFYSKYDEANQKQGTYEQILSQSSLFEFSSENNAYVAIESEDEINAFYQNELVVAYNLFLQNEEVSPSLTYLNTLSLINIGVSIGVPVIVFWVVIPSISKDGTSLGKKALGLRYVSCKQPGNKPTRPIIVLNALTFTLICGVFSLWLAGIPLLINAVFILMTNYGYGIGDFYTGMVMVDSNKFFSQGHKVKEVVLPYIKKEGEEIDEFE